MIITILLKLTELNRIIKMLIMMITDSILVILSIILAFSIRLGYIFIPTETLLFTILISPLFALPIFYRFGLYKSVTRYIGSDALISVLKAAMLYSLIWSLFCYMTTIEAFKGQVFEEIPRSVIIINCLLTLLVIGFSRLIARDIFSKKMLSGLKTNIMIYGAGNSGRDLAHTLKLSHEYNIVGFIDDEYSKQGTYINNIPVLSFKNATAQVKLTNVNEILLALPSISKKQRSKIIEKLSNLSIRIRSLPSIYDLTSGKKNIEDLLDIEITDLLGRDTVKPNQNLLKINITNKVVLITGAGGSIGSELARQTIFLNPKKLILFDISESSLYIIEQELIGLNESNIEILPIIGSIRDYSRMKFIFSKYNVQTIYHAAAYKHVPLVENNQSQGVLNNSIGTMLAVEAAISEKVETFVLISTDKAVRPKSVMGASKRIAELVLQALAKQKHNTCLAIVRFGNVLDSSGSVIPKFKEQIKKGGPVTVTDQNMYRYFMTIPEAVELVIQSGAMSLGGDVFVLDMGEPVNIYELAKKMIQFSGFQVLDDSNPKGNIEIIFTGLRPGEKLYEELLVGNDVTKTENQLIMRAKEEMIVWEKLKPLLAKLEDASINSNFELMNELLVEIVPNYKAI